MAQASSKKIEEGNLRKLIRSIRYAIRTHCDAKHGLHPDLLKTFSERLKKVSDSSPSKYKYDDKKYPELTTFGPKSVRLEREPNNTAERFIWKQGDWKKYRKFVKTYNTEKWDKPPKNRVVHFAFARHLKAKGRVPIFDQHAARAVWAIMGTRSDKCWINYREYLFKTGDHGWRSNSFLVDSQACCYADFLQDIAYIAHQSDYRKLDELLMPLGKAIKDHVNSLEDFWDLCGI